MSNTHWQIAQAMPELRTQIIDRLVGDREFQALCGDYDRCFEALQRFREQADALPERIAEYTQLLNELKQDIRAALDSTKLEHNE